MLRTGTTIAGYRIEELIGSGGMGTVYEATQLSLDRTVALKVLAAGLAAGEDFRERFRREAMLQAALEHPNIVPVYEAGASDEGLFIAMKLVRGSDLKRLREDGDLNPARALEILAQAAEALDAAHGAGLVHRDVKPQNILVDDDDRAYLADFGLTKGAGERGVTLTGQYMGSLDYTAPEQIRGEGFGASGDLYAFAAVLYEVLTGEVPFPYDTEAAILYAHISEQPPQVTSRRPELPAAVDDLVARGLAKRPEERYRSARDLVEQARRALVMPRSVAVEANGRRRSGDTIVDPAVLRVAPVIEVAEEKAVPWRSIAIATLLVAALALIGFALGRASRGGGHGTTGVAAAGPISLSFADSEWRAASAGSISGLPLDGAVALTSTRRDRPGTLVAGIVPDAQGAGLLPRALKEQLSGAATPHAAAVGRYEGLVYPTLPAARVSSRLELVLVPTTRGAAAVACLTPAALPAGTTPADCDAVAATMRLHGLHALPLAGTGAYAATLLSTLARVDGERVAGRRQLAGASRRPEQARAAHALAAAYAGAAERLLHDAEPGPLARPSHFALYGALREAQRSYGALAAAARSGDDVAYRRATHRIETAERNVDASIARLERLRP
jgi:predicted Ser/Thr protein kinase